MKRLYYLRHGESQANVDQVFAGQFDTPLTQRGREQAKAAGEQAKRLGIDYIIASPLSRTLDTAKIVAEAIGYPVEKIETYDALMERSFGSAVGTPWETDISGIADIETMDAVAIRAEQAYRHIQTLPYDTVLVVGHGTFWQKLHMVTHPGEVVNDGDEPHNAEIVQLV